MRLEISSSSGKLSFFDEQLPETAVLVGGAWVRYHTENGAVRRVDLAGSLSVREEGISGEAGAGRQLTAQGVAEHGLSLRLQARDFTEKKHVLLQLTISNRGETPVFLDELCPLQAAVREGGAFQLDVPADQLRFLRVGWHGWDHTGLLRADQRAPGSLLDRFTSLSYTNPLTPRPRRQGDFWSEGWAILAGRQLALVAGFSSTAAQFGSVHACLRTGETELTLLTQADGVRLDPGESLASEWAYLQLVSLPHPDPAADFIHTVARNMQARVSAEPPPPMWTHWYRYYQNITEELFLHNVDALVEKRSQLPFGVAELDDGFQSAWGDWTETNRKFPHGLGWLAQQVRAKGLVPGIWLAPFVVEAGSQVYRQHPDWLLRDARGKPVKAVFVYNKLMATLDPSHPGVQQHLHDLAHSLVYELGYGLLKIDFLNTGALPGSRHDPKMTRAQGLRAGLQAMRQGAGDEAFLLASGCPFGPAIGLVDGMRIGPDTAPSWLPWFNWLPWAGPLIRQEPSMPSLRNALRNTLNLSSLHRRWWWNDPDCLLVREQDTCLTEAEVQSAVTLTGLSGGMLVLSDDMRTLSSGRLGWAGRLVPNLGLRGLALDGLEHEMPQRYALKLAGLGQAWWDVALFNWQDSPADLQFNFAELGIPAGTELFAFEFWTGKLQRVQGEGMSLAAVPAHGCALLRLCQVERSPQLVGDTLHISMGAELKRLELQGELLLLETLEMGRRLEGQLWLHVEGRVKEARLNGQRVEVEEVGEGVVRVRVG